MITIFPLSSKTLREKQKVLLNDQRLSRAEVIGALLLVEFDIVGLRLVVGVIRNSFLQLAGLWAERGGH